MDIGQKQGDDVLADATVVVRTRAGGLGDAAFGERRADLIRLIVRAFTLGTQFQLLADRFQERSVAVVSFAALEALLTGQFADVRFSQTRQLLFCHAAITLTRVSKLPSSTFGKFSLFARRIMVFHALCTTDFSLDERITYASCWEFVEEIRALCWNRQAALGDAR